MEFQQWMATGLQKHNITLQTNNKSPFVQSHRRLERKKIKCTPVQALRLCTGRTAHRGSTGIALPFHDHGTRREWGVRVTLWPLFTPGKTWYPLYRRLGGPQGRSGLVRKISPPPGFDPRTVQPVASRYTHYTTLPTIGDLSEHY